MSLKQKSIVVDTCVLFVKQELARSVDFWRNAIDAKESGDLNSEEFDAAILNAPIEFGIRPWAFISLGLKFIRNYCQEPGVQHLVANHDIADTIVQRLRLVSSLSLSLYTCNFVPF